jgi:hypothetical protein
MDNLKNFLAENAIKAENVKYVASESFVGGDGKAIEWELRTLANSEIDEIMTACKKKELIPKTREYRITTDAEKAALEMACASVVYPDLNDAQLQDSYKAIGASELLKKMLTPGEYSDLMAAVQEANGFKVGMEDKINQAKN